MGGEREMEEDKSTESGEERKGGVERRGRGVKVRERNEGKGFRERGRKWRGEGERERRRGRPGKKWMKIENEPEKK